MQIKNVFSVSGIENMRSKCDPINGENANATTQPFLSSFAIEEPPGCRVTEK